MNKGVFVARDTISRFGYEGALRSAEDGFHVVTDPAARALLRGELVDLTWNGTTVVRRDQSEIDARVFQETKDSDDAHFEREREKAIFEVLLDEINVLRQAARLTPWTIQQAEAAYIAKLNR